MASESLRPLLIAVTFSPASLIRLYSNTQAALGLADERLTHLKSLRI
jgi:hypothetical protein